MHALTWVLIKVNLSMTRVAASIEANSSEFIRKVHVTLTHVVVEMRKVKDAQLAMAYVHLLGRNPIPQVGQLE